MACNYRTRSVFAIEAVSHVTFAPNFIQWEVNYGGRISVLMAGSSRALAESKWHNAKQVLVPLQESVEI